MRKIALVSILSLSTAGLARAQDAPYEPPPPPPAYTPVAPPSPPPPPQPTWNQGLVDQGNRNRAAGAALIAIGTLGLVGGVVMAGLAVDCRRSTTYYSQIDGYYREHTDCVSTNDGLLAGGVVSGLVGTGLLLSGIVTHVVGRAQLSRARRLGTWTLAPTVTPQVQGATLRLAF